MKKYLLPFAFCALSQLSSFAQVPTQSWIYILPQELVFGQVSATNRLQPADTYGIWNPSLGVRTEIYEEGLNPNLILDQYGFWQEFKGTKGMLEAYTEKTKQGVIDRQFFKFALNKMKKKGQYAVGGGFILNARSIGYGNNADYVGSKGGNSNTVTNYSTPGPFTARVRWGLGYGYNVSRQLRPFLYTRASLNVIAEPAKNVSALLVQPEFCTVLHKKRIGLLFSLAYNYSYMSGIPFPNYVVEPNKTVTTSAIRAQVAVCFRLPK